MEHGVGRPIAALRRSSAARALFIVAAIALVEVVLLGFVIGAQRDTAHIIDINGAQRMRTQRIAFLMVAARTPDAAPGWRAELTATVDEFLRVRAELLTRRDLLPEPVDARGLTAFARGVGRYADAARAFARDPRDDAALRYVLAHRVPLLAQADRSVKGRTAIIARRNVGLIEGLVAGLLAMFATILIVWKRIVEPSERQTATLLAKLADNDAQMRSLFRENPDAIAMYDARGRILRGNHASAVLLGTADGELIGADFSRHVDEASLELVSASFARALAGERVSFDARFVDAQGERIDVQASLFPSVVDGRTTGVIGVAKDMRALKSVQRAYVSQSERITELYRAAAYQNRSWTRQVEETLAVAAQRLGYDWAIAAQIADGDARAVTVVGNAGVALGDVIPLPQALLRRASRARDVWAIGDVARSSLCEEPAIVASGWGALLGAPIHVGATTFGTVVLGAARGRASHVEPADRDFLRLVAALVATSIQRGEHERKLDTLAFFDALTGLPNRVLLADRLTELLNAGARRKRPFAVHCLDLDRFKIVNDTYGHAVGDDVLRIAAHRMTQCVREGDTVARVGGDEFVILQPFDGDGRAAGELAERVIAAFAKPFSTESAEHVIGVSIGISLYPADGADGQTLLRSADDALLRAKRAGRNRRTFAA